MAYRRLRLSKVKPSKYFRTINISPVIIPRISYCWVSLRLIQPTRLYFFPLPTMTVKDGQVSFIDSQPLCCVEYSLSSVPSGIALFLCRCVTLWCWVLYLPACLRHRDTWRPHPFTGQWRAGTQPIWLQSCNSHSSAPFARPYWGCGWVSSASQSNASEVLFYIITHIFFKKGIHLIS